MSDTRELSQNHSTHSLICENCKKITIRFKNTYFLHWDQSFVAENLTSVFFVNIWKMKFLPGFRLAGPSRCTPHLIVFILMGFSKNKWSNLAWCPLSFELGDSRRLNDVIESIVCNLPKTLIASWLRRLDINFFEIAVSCVGIFKFGFKLWTGICTRTESNLLAKQTFVNWRDWTN